MLINSSRQVTRWGIPNRLPSPKKFGASPVSRAEEGEAWPEPVNAKRVKRLRISRDAPDTGRNPRLDANAIERDACGPMLLNALIKLKKKIGPTLTCSRSSREGVRGCYAMNIDGGTWLTCIHLFDKPSEPVAVYSPTNMDVLKEMVGDTDHLLAPCASLKPW